MINRMDTQRERIALVESDPQVCDLIAEQTLRPMGYPVEVFASASPAIKDIERTPPDLIITNLDLPGISGKDLMIALTSQGIYVPIIVISSRGREADILQAIRLGAANFLTHPLREAEVLSVVEDTLSHARKRKELELFSHQMDRVKAEVEGQCQNLIDIFSIANETPRADNQASIYEKIVSSALKVSGADAAWMAVLDFTQNRYILRACLNAAENMQSMLNLPFEDNLTSLVAVSNQAISLHADALKPFSLSRMVEAVLVVPIKFKDGVVGMIAVERNTPQPFTNVHNALLELIADYAACLIGNIRRYQILEQQAFHLHQSRLYTTMDSSLKNDLLHQASLELRTPLKNLIENLDVLTSQMDRRLPHKQTVALNSLHEEAEILMDIADSIVRVQNLEDSEVLGDVDLTDVIRQVVNRYQTIAHVHRITVKLELPVLPACISGYSSQITKVIEGLVSNALKYSPPRTQITIRVETKEDVITVSVRDQGEGIAESRVEKLFEKDSNLYGEQARRFGGIGISLPVIREIISAHKGQIWVESGYGKGFCISFSVPRS